jgi:hypothetical protein
MEEVLRLDAPCPYADDAVMKVRPIIEYGAS